MLRVVKVEQRKNTSVFSRTTFTTQTTFYNKTGRSTVQVLCHSEIKKTLGAGSTEMYSKGKNETYG